MPLGLALGFSSLAGQKSDHPKTWNVCPPETWGMMRPIRVPAGMYFLCPFRTTEEATDVQLAGRFRAQGGSGNDIRVLVGHAEEVENALNGHGGRVYSTGPKTVGTFGGPIDQPGDYLVAFDNTFSLLSDKDVWADVVLTYRERPREK